MAEKETAQVSNANSNPPQTQQSSDPNLITWDGPADPENPKNWPQSRKWMTILPMSLFNFLSSMSSATMAPALDAIQKDLHMSSLLAILSLSIFLLGTAFIPLFTAPLSEVFGRSLVLQSANIFYILFNALCGVAQNSNQLIIFRLLAGFGGAGPFAANWKRYQRRSVPPHERGQAIAVYTLAPLAGVVIGPIAGGFLVQYTSWRWCFYVVSIIGAGIQILGLPFFRETYAPILLQRKCRRLQKSTQNPNLYTEHDNVSLPQLLRTSLVRPFKLLATQPIVQVWSLYCAFLWGILYLLIATFPTVWTDIYDESVSIGSLNYISMFVGMGLASQLGTRLADRYYNQLCAKNNGHSLPEFRLPVLIIGAFIVPVGLFWYAWSARSSVHWIMPNIGMAIYSGGTVLEILCVMGYIIDTYQKFAASAMAAIIVLRSILAFALPLVAPSLYGNLGFDWGNSLLAFTAIFIGIPAPLLLRYYGPALRRRSPYARDD